MILGRAIIERLTALIVSEQTEDYYEQIKPVLQEVIEAYEKTYGKELPKVYYSQLVEEFTER